MSLRNDPRPATSAASTPSAPGTGTEPAGAWRSVQLVASREIMMRFRSRSYLITTALLVVAVVIGGFLIQLATGSSEATTVAFTPQTSSIASTVEATAKGAEVDISTSTVASADAGEQQVRDGDLDVLVGGTPGKMTLVVNKDIDPTIKTLMTQVASQEALSTEITSLGGNPQAVGEAVTAATPTVQVLDPSTQNSAGSIAGMIAGILLFVALMSSGQLVATGVVEEKSSRVVELLLATIRPWQLMAGKVLGIGIVGLVQVALTAGAAVAVASATDIVDPSELNIGAMAGWTLVWFVVGFVSYALLMAGAAALVSRQEDVGAVLTPILAFLMVPYILGVSIAPWAPDNPLIVILSFVPLCAPMLMPIRIALGTVDMWEVFVALGLSVALIPVLVWLAGRIYSNAVLRTGSRVKLKDAFRGAH